MNEATVQQKAYDAGVTAAARQCLPIKKQPHDLLWVQAATGYDDESLVCYLNGIADALAGISVRGDLLVLPKAA